MLVNPELFAFLTRYAQTSPTRKEAVPLVTRAEKIHKGGPQKTRPANYQDDKDDEDGKDVEYLNEKKSNLNFYA